MKKQTMHNHLQKQYAKLNQRIQKAMQTGRFYAYTQFKQQQLLSRLKRCSFQLKQLGTGVVVVAALGMATPAVGQDNFIKKPSVLALQTVKYKTDLSFVDIDGDGDLDLFTDSLYSTSQVDANATLFYENIGTAIAPIYVKRQGMDNPLDLAKNLVKPSFVDIDGDGDLDCFSGHEIGINDPNAYTFGNLSYYENQGSTTIPNFVLQTGAGNPLDSINYLGTYQTHRPAFVDIDNDGDQDFFAGVKSYTNEILFYENTGTSTIPTFLKRTGVSNPLNLVNQLGLANTLAYIYKVDLQFTDMDLDGDQDVFVTANFGTGYACDYVRYFENTGNVGGATFNSNNTTPLDLISTIDSTTFFRLVDIDADGDLDVYNDHRIDYPAPYGSSESSYYENQRIITDISIIEEQSELGIYPNPTSKILNFEQPIQGTVQIYNISGQLVHNIELQNEQELNLESLQNGMYFLEIQREKGRIRKKVLIQK